jgi:hypothetical protein
VHKNTVIILLIIITAGFFLRYHGHSWGIPQAPYWRNHFQDEAFVLGRVLSTNPNDLNPHYFINPSFHYYTLLSSIKTASVLDFIKPFSLPVELNKLGQPTSLVLPSDYQRMYLIGRLISLLYSTAVILLVFFIGCNLYDIKTGLIAAAFTAVLPTLAFQAHFLVVDTPAVFWFILTFFFSTGRRLFKNHIQWLIISSISLGIAIGTKYTNAIVILPLLYGLYVSNRHAKKNVLPSIFSKDLFILIGICVVVFFLTTPHAILSFKEFLYGDNDGFGGIFGARGLFAYNDYPTNIITPFTLATYHSLRLPLSILALVGVIWLLIKRKFSDIMLLFVIVPFYLLLIYRASPHLRHAIAVLPLLMLATARVIVSLFFSFKKKVFKYTLLFVCGAVFLYTFLFSFSYIGRFTKIDTRTACADWLKPHLTEQTTVGITTFFPWNYTPPIDMLTKKIMVTGYSHDTLLAARPDYFIITEYEFREFYRARATEQECEVFVQSLFSENDYKIIKVFQRRFAVLGMDFKPDFPNMDWNPVNPAIYIFKIKS